MLAAKIELGDGPGGDHPEHQIERHGDGGDQQGQDNGGSGIRLDQRGEIDPQPLRKASAKTVASGSNRNKRRSQGDGDQYAFHPGWFAGSGVGFEALRVDGPMGGNNGAHAPTLARLRLAQTCKPLIRKSSAKETTSMTTAMAVAPA